MRIISATLLACFLTISMPLLRGQDGTDNGFFSPDQLDNLAAPVALYPDPLLAQVLLAATFPDQIDEAARFVRANPDPYAIDSQYWDVSVKAVAHYPTVLYMMADKLDWTTALGQAYANQSADVMASVQRLRAEARDAGNLVTTPQQQVMNEDGNIEIWPAEPQYIYVPEYDPAIVYVHRGGFFSGSAISFGTGFSIGVWLNHDFDWRGHGVLYVDWQHPHGWYERSMPFVHVNNVYVNNNYRNVVFNRTVINRQVNYGALNRYNTVHRDVTYNNVRGTNAYAGNPGANSGWGNSNKVIERNMNTNDPRINAYRGQSPSVQTPVQQAPRYQQNQPAYQQPAQQVQRPQQSQPAYQPPVQQNRAAYQPAQQSNTNAAFGGNRGNFNATQTSARGQQSRAQVSNPTPSHAGGGGQAHGSGGNSGHEDNGGRR